MNPDERSQISAASVSFWGSITLFAVSAGAGLAVDSITLMLDASASLVILVVAFLMNATIKKIHSPPDEIFNFGYEKYEPFTVVLQGCLIITTCVISMKFAIQDIVHAESMTNYIVPIIAAAICVVIGMYISIFLRITAKRTGSSMVHAASMHWFIDTMMSVGMLGGFCLGFLFEKRGYTAAAPYVDPVMAILLALIFILPPIKAIRKNLMELLDAVPSKEVRAKVKKVVDEYKPRMFGVHRLRTRKAGNKIFVEICFVVKEEMTVKEVEAVAADFEKSLRSHLPHTDVVVYFKPVSKVSAVIAALVAGSMALALAASMLLLSGCDPQDIKSITFAVGGAPSEVKFWDGLVAGFEKDTGIKVRIIRQPTDTDQRRQGLVISLKAHESDPDVFLMDVAWVSQFAASDWLEPLDGGVNGPPVDTSVFFKKVIDTADKYNGKLIALPVYVDGGLLYYRKDLLGKYGYEGPPRTWQELIDMSLKVQEGERKGKPSFYGFVWQGAQYEGLVCNFLEFAGPDGGISIKPGRVSVDSQANVRALGMMRDFIAKYRISPPNTFTEMKEEEVRAFFGQGNALFERNWPYAWALHQGKGSAVAGKTGIAALPSFKAGRSFSVLGGWHAGISKYSNMKKDAYRFVEYLASFAAQKKMALSIGWNPGRRDLYTDKDILAKHPHFAELGAIFSDLHPRPAVPYYTLISEVLQRRLNAALSGKETPEAALSAAQKECREIVDRYGKK